MPEHTSVFAVTGDSVVRFTLDRGTAGEPEVVLDGVSARCIATDPHDPSRVYVGSRSGSSWVA